MALEEANFCGFCNESFDEDDDLGPKIGPIKIGCKKYYAHRSCAEWTPEVFITPKGSFKNLPEALKRSRQMKCSYCGEKGGGMGCWVQSCMKTYHVKCAQKAGCVFFLLDFIIGCPNHVDDLLDSGHSGACDAFKKHYASENKKVFGIVQDPMRCLTKRKRAWVNNRILKSNEALKTVSKHDGQHVKSDGDCCDRKSKASIAKIISTLKPIIVGGKDQALPVHSLGGGLLGVGGQQKAVTSLWEMVVLPLMYPSLFADVKLVPPRGVLLYGPPGCGKTHLVRCLVEECAMRLKSPIALFLRKASDCLAKFHGESEKTLKVLFEEARKHAPSIIFLDELDGLLPARRSGETGHDQVFSSIVSTMLALMDGLTNRGNVVVIGATNKPEALDSAFRRPGRFDRELLVGYPNEMERHQILEVHTRHWPSPPKPNLLAMVSQSTDGFSGADLKDLCSAAAMESVHRKHPEIMELMKKTLQGCSEVEKPPAVSVLEVAPEDWWQAFETKTPSDRRGGLGWVDTAFERVPLARKAAADQVEVVVEVIKCIRRGKWCLPGSEELCSNQNRSEKFLRKELIKLGRAKMGKVMPGIYSVLLWGGSKGKGLAFNALMAGMQDVPVHRATPSGFLLKGDGIDLILGCSRFIKDIDAWTVKGAPLALYTPSIECWEKCINSFEGLSVWKTFIEAVDKLAWTRAVLLMSTSDVAPRELPLPMQQHFGYVESNGGKPSLGSTIKVLSSFREQPSTSLKGMNRWVREMEPRRADAEAPQQRVQTQAVVHLKSAHVEWHVSQTALNMETRDFSGQICSEIQRLGRKMCEDNRCKTVGKFDQSNSARGPRQKRVLGEPQNLMDVMTAAKYGDFESVVDFQSAIQDIVQELRVWHRWYSDPSDSGSLKAYTSAASVMDDVNAWVHDLRLKLRRLS